MASRFYDGYAFVYEALVGFFAGGEVVIFKESAEDLFLGLLFLIRLPIALCRFWHRFPGNFSLSIDSTFLNRIGGHTALCLSPSAMSPTCMTMKVGRAYIILHIIGKCLNKIVIFAALMALK